MAKHRHQRDANARRKFTPRAAFVAAPLAVLATAPAVALGVLSADLPTVMDVRTPSTSLMAGGNVSTANRGEIVSRSASRGASVSGAKQAAAAKPKKAKAPTMQELKAASRKAVRNADTKLWTTTELNLWTGPGDQAVGDGVIEAGEHILITGRRDQGRVEIVVGDKARWVTQGYLSEDKPEPEPGQLGLGGVCSNGTTVNGSANVGKVHEAVCANFPMITTYGVWRAGATDHSSGHAVDIMVSGPLGWDIANFVRANAGALGVSYVIYAQHIWSVERAGEGWRGMSNRGSVTANHFDHVHVSTY